jgi:hypothetical protein
MEFSVPLYSPRIRFQGSGFRDRNANAKCTGPSRDALPSAEVVPHTIYTNYNRVHVKISKYVSSNFKCSLKSSSTSESAEKGQKCTYHPQHLQGLTLQAA